MVNNTKTQSCPKLLFLVPAISQTHKSLENFQDFFVKTKTKTKTLGLKTKTKTLFFVLEAPRDQDFCLEDYITGYRLLKSNAEVIRSNRSCRVLLLLLRRRCNIGITFHMACD